MQYLRFAAAFVVYTVIDVGWNVSPLARGMYDSLYEASGGGQALALLAFLLLIALGNSYLAIEPAVKERSLQRAMKNAFVLGCAAYATYIVPIYLMMSTWPGVLVPIDILIGGLLSLITSTVVTYVTLRRNSS